MKSEPRTGGDKPKCRAKAWPASRAQREARFENRGHFPEHQANPPQRFEPAPTSTTTDEQSTFLVFLALSSLPDCGLPNDRASPAKAPFNHRPPVGHLPRRLRQVHAHVRPLLTDQRKPLRVVDGFDCKVHVNLWPIKMTLALEFHLHERADWNFQEPREVVERNELLLIPNEDPEALSRDVGDLSARSARTKLCGWHSHAFVRGAPPH